MLTKLRIPSYVRSVIDAEGAVLLDIRGGRYFSLNGVAAEIWRQLEAGLTLRDIETHLCGLYDASSETLRCDLAAFVERLASAKLIDAGE